MTGDVQRPERPAETGDAPLVVSAKERVWTLTFNRPQTRNAIDGSVLDALAAALDRAEADPDCRIVVLRGSGGFFCTGMDLTQVPRDDETRGAPPPHDRRYMDLLGRFSSSPKVILAQVQGTVMAGGVGLVAASDLVVAGDCRFSLSEALWGLLPACVAPYLIRRIGFQPAYRMTLTTEPIDGVEAHRIGLVDVYAQNTDEAVRRQLLRLQCLESETVVDLKRYFRRLSSIDESTERAAVSESARLINEPRVRRNIRRYVEEQHFPWEKD